MKRSYRRGFTLIELLVVIAIIAVLIALLLPAVQAAREAARRTQCVNNFKQMGLAMHNYHGVVDTFPIGRMGSGYTYPNNNNNRRTWAFSILPYLEQGNVFNAVNMLLPFYYADNTTVIRTPFTMFQCPSDIGSSTIQEPDTPYPRKKASMGVNWGNSHYWQDDSVGPGPNPYLTGPLGPVQFLGAPFKGNRAFGFRDMSDGTSNTILMGEVKIGVNAAGGHYDHRGDLFNDDYNCAMFMAYTTPNSKIPDQMAQCDSGFQGNPVCNKLSPKFNASRSYHPGGVNILFSDGSVKFIKDSINMVTWRALSTSNGGEVISADSY